MPVHVNSSEATIIEAVKQAHQTNTWLQIVGASQHLPSGMRDTNATTLNITQHTGVVDYVPDDLVITVKAGTTIAEILQTAAAHKQTLALIAPNEQSTIGGLLALDAVGHGMPLLGSLRHVLLGVRLIDGQGRVLNFGGTVVKNVAGYDVSRLQIGAFGAFGVISEVSLKLIPQAEVAADVSVDGITPTDALAKMQTLARQYLPIIAISHAQDTLMVRLAGSKVAVQQAQNVIGGHDAQHDWRMHTWLNSHMTTDEQQQSLWAWMVSTSAPIVEHTLRLDWAGNKRWLRADEATMQQLLEQYGGYTLYMPNSLLPKRHLPPVMQQQLVRLKRVFDPKRCLNQKLFDELVLSA